jgi:hypothetical protein
VGTGAALRTPLHTHWLAACTVLGGRVVRCNLQRKRRQYADITEQGTKVNSLHCDRCSGLAVQYDTHRTREGNPTDFAPAHLANATSACRGQLVLMMCNLAGLDNCWQLSVTEAGCSFARFTPKCVAQTCQHSEHRQVSSW